MPSWVACCKDTYDLQIIRLYFFIVQDVNSRARHRSQKRESSPNCS